MGLYIPNAELPKYGHKIEIMCDGSASYVDYVNPYEELGYVVPLPINHGALVDVDALSELVGEPFEVFLSRLDLKMPKIEIPAEHENKHEH